MSMFTLTRGFLGLFLLVIASAAQSELLKPMMLAYTKPGADVATEAMAVRDRLTTAGFRVLGEYAVDDNARVMVFTSDELLAAAAGSDRGAYAAPLRVSVTRIGTELQVSYNDLEYFRHAYQLDRSLAGAMSRLASTLGAKEAFGAQGLTPAVLGRYRYAFGMERFGDPYLLATYPSRERALAALEANLSTGKGGVREVYRVDIPGRDATLIGVSIREEEGADQYASDHFNLGTVDVGDRRHTAYLPYEILVDGGRVEALHMRFRMALHFPDLSMMGENSFMQLRRSPAAVERALTEAAGG
ncbi:hypothetical protein [Thioalkalivibrio sp.]|uniref:hypothetical protein n=1 Tax=Thioalkalivibrio sp. TaxID=2093813 RepID=UPI0012D67198|nr:hypothetical protein [Thioalkalivibrio sp.]TVP81703.1 MAG: hypothetical protein EA346_04515 [Thioalkalivibrio sp.]